MRWFRFTSVINSTQFINTASAKTRAVDIFASFSLPFSTALSSLLCVSCLRSQWPVIRVFIVDGARRQQLCAMHRDVFSQYVGQSYQYALVAVNACESKRNLIVMTQTHAHSQ